MSTVQKSMRGRAGLPGESQVVRGFDLLTEPTILTAYNTLLSAYIRRTDHPWHCVACLPPVVNGQTPSEANVDESAEMIITRSRRKVHGPPPVSRQQRLRPLAMKPWM